MRRTERILAWLTNLFLLGVSAYVVGTYPLALRRELLVCTLLVGVGGVVLAGWRRRWRFRVDLFSAVTGLVLVELSLAIAGGAIDGLPPPAITRATVHLVHLGPFYRLVHCAVVFLVTSAVVEDHRRFSVAESGLLAVLAYGVLNGTFFGLVQSERWALLFGLSLATFVATLPLRPDEDETTRPWGSATRGLSVPVGVFLLVGLLATVTSVYVYNSLARWQRLAHWVLIGWLIVRIVRERRQAERVMMLLLGMAGLVSLAGLVGLVAYGFQVGWSTALGARLWVGTMHPNGVATFGVTYLTLGLGILLAWPSARRRLAVGIALVPLLACILLTYSRSAAGGLLLGLATLVTFRWSTGKGRSGAVRWVTLGLAVLLPLLLVGVSTLVRSPGDVLTSRAALWRVTLNTIAHRPVLGVGLGNHFVPAFSAVLSYDDLVTVRHLVDTHAHNLFLQVGQAMGLLGLGSLFWLLVAAGQHTVRAVRGAAGTPERSLLVALAAAQVALLAPHLLVLSLSEDTLLPASFWVLLGLTVALSRSGARRPARPPGTSVAGPGAWRDVTLAGLALVVTILCVVRPLVAEGVLGGALAAWQTGRPAEAQARLQVVARLRPLDARMAAYLAQAVEDPALAIDHAGRASRLRPLHAPYHTRLGWLYWRQDRPDLVTAAFERAVALDPYGVNGGLHQPDLGLVYAATDRREEALAAFRDGLLLDETIVSTIWEPDWYATQGGVALDPTYTRYAQTGEVDPQLDKRIAYHLREPEGDPAAFERQGDPTITLDDLAAVVRARAEAVEPVDRDGARAILLRLSELYLDWALYDAFQATLLEVEALTEPGTFAAALNHRRRGAALQRQGTLLAAQEELEAAVLLADEPAFRYHLATIYRQRGLLDEAIAEMEKAAPRWDPSVVHYPGWFDFWRDLAAAYQQAGRYEDAADAYRKARFLADSVPVYVELCASLGQAYRFQGDYEREMDAYGHGIAVLATQGQPGPREAQLVQVLATQAATSYRLRGIEPQAALEEQASWIDGDTPVGAAYLAVLEEELGVAGDGH